MKFCKICSVILAIFTALLSVLTAAAFFLAVCEGLADRTARILPSYAREDLTSVLAQETWSDADYELLYRQTGLGRAALDALGTEPERILTFQDALFYEGEVAHVEAADTTMHDIVANYTAPVAPLEDGDVLVSSSCHTFGWRNGHAAIVTNAKTQTTLESVSLGYNSSFGSAGWFRSASNFIVLRLKEEYAGKEERAEIAAWAAEHLYDVPYSLLVGFTIPKDQGADVAATHCSHLVWSAYRYFGFDIDSDGGPVVTARDIANSPYFEIVQVYGFDPLELW